MESNRFIAASKNALAVLMGLSFAILLAILVDKTFGWFMDVKGGNSYLFPLGDDIDGLGWTIRVKNEAELQETTRNYSLARKKVRDGVTIYDVTYNFDSLYRRLVPEHPDDRADKFVIFFGGSQTFGEGLNDLETIPATLQQSNTDYRVYNYAYSGYGPHQMLRKLETTNMTNEVTETKGIAFYQYFTFHVPRALGTMKYISWAGGAAPYYQINSNGDLVYKGSFASGRFFTTLFYWLLSKSAIANYYNVDIPSRLTPRHHETVCRVIEKSRDVFTEQFTDSRFVVMLGISTSKKDKIVDSCLEKHKIKYIDLRKRHKSKKALTFPHDGHFTPKASRLIAKELQPVLDQYR